MTEEAPQASNYLTGSARFENGFLEELVIYCMDPLTPELEAVGFMEQSYEALASRVVEDIKRGDKFFARFDGSRELYPLEVVTRHGRETLEVKDVGQPAEFKSLHNLPTFTAPEKQEWVLVFYDTYKALTQEKLGYQILSYLSWGAYADHGHKDPAAAARDVFDATYAHQRGGS
jgi:hypothetical protein